MIMSYIETRLAGLCALCLERAVGVYSSRHAWRPADVSGCFLRRMRFTSLTQMLESK
jgi:hypothetical protein